MRSRFPAARTNVMPVIVSMPALLEFDIVLFTLINSFHSKPADFLFLAVTQLGSGWVIGPVLLLIMARSVRGARLTRVVIVSVVALTASGLVNSAIKSAVGRPRPVGHFGTVAAPDSTGLNAYAVHTVGARHRHRSFPSGHTNTAFAAATLCVVLLGWQFWPMYIPAALVGYSRVYLGLHFPLDIVFGAILGTGVTWAVARTARRVLPVNPPEKEPEHDA